MCSVLRRFNLLSVIDLRVFDASFIGNDRCDGSTELRLFADFNVNM